MRVRGIRIACYAVALGVASLVGASHSAAEPPAPATAPKLSQLKSPSSSLKEQLHALELKKDDPTICSDPDALRLIFEEAIVLSRKELPEFHPLVRRLRSFLKEFDWYVALDEGDRDEFGRALQQLAIAQGKLRRLEFKSALNDLDEVRGVFTKLGTLPSIAAAEVERSRAACFVRMSRIKDAIAASEEACRIAEATEGPYSELLAKCLQDQNNVLQVKGDLIVSSKAIRHACRIYYLNGDESLIPYATALLWSAQGLATFDDTANAQRCIDEAQGIIVRIPQPSAGLRLHALGLQSRVFCSTGKLADAKQIAEDYLSLSRREYGIDSKETMIGEHMKAEAQLALNEIKDAHDTLQHATDISIKVGVPIELSAMGTAATSRLLIREGKADKAVEILQKQIDSVNQGFGAQSPALRSLLRNYAIALDKVGRTKEAEQAKSRAAEIDALIQKMRHEVESDPECKFPWEQ